MKKAMRNIAVIIAVLSVCGCEEHSRSESSTPSELSFTVQGINEMYTRAGHDSPADMTSTPLGFLVYVVDDPADLATTGNRADGHQIKWDGSAWFNATTRASGKPLEWPKTGTVSVFAYLPFMRSGANVKAIPIQIVTDQSALEDLKQSDFIVAKAPNCQKSENGTIPLTFYHKLSKLKFNLTWNDPSEILTSLSVSPLFRTGTYNLVTDKITTNLTHQSNPQAYIYNKTSTSATAEVILMPQEVSKGNFVTIVTERNGQKIYYVLNLPENLLLDGSTLYNFNVSLEFNEESDIIIKPSMLSVEKWEEREEGNWELDANVKKVNGLDLFTDGTKELFILEETELQLSANRKTGIECSIVRKDQKPFSNKIKFSVNGEETTRFTLGETPVRFGIFPKEFGENEYLLNITDGEEKLQYPLNFKAICRYDLRQVPVTMTFTKSSVDNIDRKIDLNEANTIKSDFWRLVGNGFTWYFDKSSDIPDHGIQSSLNPRQMLLFPAGKSEITVPVGTINVPYFSNITSDVSIDMNLTQRLCHATGAFNCEYSGTLDFDLVSESETKSWKTPAINFTTGFMIPISYLDKVTSVNFHSTINIVNKPVVLETLTSESYPLKAGVISEIIDLAILKTPEYYNPLYDCQIAVSPASAGKLSVKKYLHKGGFVIEELNSTSFTHEARTQIYFTPTSTSGESVTFCLKVTDKNGTSAEKTVKYTISK